MATKTKYLQLTKDAKEDKYSIDTINENLDKIDEGFHQLDAEKSEMERIHSELNAQLDNKQPNLHYHERLEITEGTIHDFVIERMREGYQGGDIVLLGYTPSDTYKKNGWGLIRWVKSCVDIIFLTFHHDRTTIQANRCICPDEGTDTGWIEMMTSDALSSRIPTKYIVYSQEELDNILNMPRADCEYYEYMLCVFKSGLSLPGGNFNVIGCSTGDYEWQEAKIYGINTRRAFLRTRWKDVWKNWYEDVNTYRISQNAETSDMYSIPSSAVTHNLQQQINKHTKTIEIVKGEDLNDEKYWEVGRYYCRSNEFAEKISNCPIDTAFTMETFFSTGVANPCQVITDYWTGRTIRRLRCGDSIGGWTEPNGVRSGKTEVNIPGANVLAQKHVTFNIPFLGNSPKVILQVLDSSNDPAIYTYPPIVGNPTKTGFDIRLKRAHAGTASVNWMAIQ